MVDQEVEELVALCGSVPGDGELTEEEAYQLGDWLNHHDEAAEHWPGNQLIQPLQEVWTDGAASNQGLYRLARLLVSIQREWARRPRTKITPLTSAPLPHIATDQIDQVRLPTLHGRFQVPSQNEARRLYEVNLNGPTCSCPDWRDHRSRLPAGDLTRCCKHVLHIYARLLDPGATDNWLVGFIENACPPHPGAQWHLLDHNGSTVLFCTPSEKGWADVFASDGERYRKFGYNTLEERWAYGVEPEDAGPVASAIAQHQSEKPAAIYTYVAKEPMPLPPSAAPLPPPPPPVSFLPPATSPRPQRRRGWILAAGSVAVLLIVAGFFAAREMKSAHPKPSTVSLPPSGATPRSAPGASSAPIRPAVVLPAGASTPSLSGWTVVTRQNVKARAGKKEIAIPKGTTLKVIARTNHELMISYKGEDLTIPASSTMSTR